MMKLLTPGPLTTTKKVRAAMLEDRCTWDESYKTLTQNICENLLDIAGVSEEDYTAVLMQGSGSFVVESVFHTAMNDADHVLIVTNGAYGKRMVTMVNKMGRKFDELSVPFHSVPAKEQIEKVLQDNPHITHVAMVHCETTTGILNPIEEIGQVVQAYDKTYIVDAMSSFGGVPIDMTPIDYLVSSANKCIHGVPGFGFVIAKESVLQKCKGNAKSLSLDLYDQWETMSYDGKWRFTSPTHVVGAFYEALKEMQQLGGIKARHEHYLTLNTYLRAEMKKLGFKAYVEAAVQSPIITSFYYPHAEFSFDSFYEAVKRQGFILYPGKLTNVDTFRIGNIGDIKMDDMERLIDIVKAYLEVTTWRKYA